MTENAWVEEGYRAASVLDGVSSAVVVGRDGEAAAWVALGMARAQAARRRVAVADLVGEVGPLQSLIDPNADPHGISDSFRYGVSLNKIAHAADASGNLFVLPSGSEEVAVEDVFASDRWRRLASGFREVGALLLLVARADTPGLDTLANSVDGVVIAGEATGALADAAPPLAVIVPTRRRPARSEPSAFASAPNAERPTSGAFADALRAATSTPRADEEVPEPGPRRWVRWAAIAAGALAAAAMLSFYLLPRRTAVQGDERPPADTTRASVPAVAESAAAAPGAIGDSLAAIGADTAVAAAGGIAALVVANPTDSASAVPYSVYISAANTAQGASDALGASVAATIPVIAMTPVLQDGAPWYRLLVGAYPGRRQADSLLLALQERGLLGPGSGRVVRTPYALLVADRVPAADVPARVQALAKRNVPVYPMSHGDGTIALYAGAFESPQEAEWLARALQSAGVTPRLVYRTGRSL